VPRQMTTGAKLRLLGYRQMRQQLSSRWWAHKDSNLGPAD
jgi:hypothetical protein